MFQIGDISKMNIYNLSAGKQMLIFFDTILIHDNSSFSILYIDYMIYQFNFKSLNMLNAIDVSGTVIVPALVRRAHVWLTIINRISIIL